MLLALLAGCVHNVSVNYDNVYGYFTPLAEPSNLVDRSFMSSPEVRALFDCGRVYPGEEKAVECYDLGDGDFVAYYSTRDSCILAWPVKEGVLAAHVSSGCKEELIEPFKEGEGFSVFLHDYRFFSIQRKISLF